MIKKFSTFGSCSSRMIFNSKLNNNYKNFFKVDTSVEAVTLISLMSDPIEVDSDLIYTEDDYSRYCVYNDFSKDFLDFLSRDYIDYLIIDTYFDVELNVIPLSDNKYLSESGHLSKTEFHKFVCNNDKLNIKREYNKYLSLWKHSCDLFFEFINNNCKNTKIILNCSRMVYKYYDNSNLITDENFKKRAESNSYRDILDRYILENFDVETLPFDNNTLSFQDHPWENHPTHYEPKYYQDKTKQLNEIIERNAIFNYNYKFNSELRRLQRENIILHFNQIISDNGVYNYFLKDIGMIGNKNNNVWFDMGDKCMMTIDNIGTTITNNNDDVLQVVAKKPNDYNWYPWKIPFTIEFDLLEYSNPYNLLRVQSNKNGGYCTFENLELTNNNHVKIIAKHNKIYFYVDGEYKIEMPVSDCSEGMIIEIRLVNKDSSLTYKNFYIY